MNKKFVIALWGVVILITLISSTWFIINSYENKGKYVNGCFFFSKEDYNEKLSAEKNESINKIFSVAKRSEIYIWNSKLELKKGECGIFQIEIKNIHPDDGIFNYSISAFDPLLQRRCGNINEKEAEAWITEGREMENLSINHMKNVLFNVTFTIPENAPACTIRYHLNVYKYGYIYEINIFDLQIQ